MYELPPIHTLATTIQKNISNMNMQSSPGFDPFSASFIKHAEKTVQDDRGKRHTENVLLPLLTTGSSNKMALHLFLSDGVTPHLWNKFWLCTRKVQLHFPKSFRSLAINGCIYGLIFVLTDWALAEHQTPDSQFGFCPTRNTNQPLYILRHILATAKKQNEGVHYFSGPLRCLQQCSKREALLGDTCEILRFCSI